MRRVEVKLTHRGGRQAELTLHDCAVDEACGEERTTWTCEHRVRSAVNMIAFRKATASAPTVSNWWDDGSNRIAFGRGDRGFVVINREATGTTRTFATGMAPGRYCDVVGGDFAGGACTGTVVTVDSGGQADIAVPANGAVAINVGAALP